MMKKLSIVLLMLLILLPLTAGGSSENTTVLPAAEPEETGIPVTLTVGDIVLDAYLYDTASGRSLALQLPLTVTLNDSDNDFCGGNLDIEYSADDEVYGYRNGDLCLWTPADNFVIFVHSEETSASTGNLVRLGHITSPAEDISRLSGRIDVAIALKEENTNMRVRITAGGQTMYAEFEDNAVSRALIGMMPMTLDMMDLYGREMCYRFGAGALATDNLRSDGYAIGDIAYWPPAGSLVILYEQNGERFQRQHVGHIDSGVDIFSTLGDTSVTFELAD